jgi:hypothetical protein
MKLRLPVVPIALLVALLAMPLCVVHASAQTPAPPQQRPTSEPYT